MHSSGLNGRGSRAQELTFDPSALLLLVGEFFYVAAWRVIRAWYPDSAAWPGTRPRLALWNALKLTTPSPPVSPQRRPTRSWPPRHWKSLTGAWTSWRPFRPVTLSARWPPTRWVRTPASTCLLVQITHSCLGLPKIAHIPLPLYKYWGSSAMLNHDRQST